MSPTPEFAFTSLKSLTCILRSFILPPSHPCLPSPSSALPCLRPPARPPPPSPCGLCHLFTDEWPLRRHDLNVSRCAPCPPSSCSLPGSLPLPLGISQIVFGSVFSFSFLYSPPLPPLPDHHHPPYLFIYLFLLTLTPSAVRRCDSLSRHYFPPQGNFSATALKRISFKKKKEKKKITVASVRLAPS